MKGKQILVSLLILAVLGIYYWFFEIKKKSGDEKAKASQELLLPELSGAQAVEISLEGEDGRITLKKNGTQWEMTEPLKAPADSPVCGALIARLSAEKYGRKLDNVNLEDFGLLQPGLKIIITGSDSKKHGIYFGPPNPSGETVYAALPGDTNTAYTVSAVLKTECSKKVFDWRDKQVLNLEGLEVDSIEVKLKDKKYKLTKTAGEWKAVSHTSAAVRADRVEAMLTRIKNSAAKSMEEASPANLIRRSLAAPAEYVSFSSGKVEHRLSFGRSDEKNSTRFARGTYLPDILEIPEGVYTAISGLDNLLEKRAIVFAREEAVKMKIKYAGREIMAVKKSEKNKAEKWEVKEAKGFTAEEKKMISPASVIYYVSNFEFKDKKALKHGVNEETAYGIKPGEGLEIYGEKDAVIAVLLIGKQVEGKEEFYVKAPLTGFIYTAEKNFIQGLNLPGLEVK